jgi:hypothetical protein
MICSGLVDRSAVVLVGGCWIGARIEKTFAHIDTAGIDSMEKRAPTSAIHAVDLLCVNLEEEFLHLVEVCL